MIKNVNNLVNNLLLFYIDTMELSFYIRQSLLYQCLSVFKENEKQQKIVSLSSKSCIFYRNDGCLVIFFRIGVTY